MASNAINVSYDWQSEMNVCERNMHMLENELETDVTFEVSSPQDGKFLLAICLNENNTILYNIMLYV